MDNQETATVEHSKACMAFAEGIQHPNEKTLAMELLEGKSKEGDFSLGFDQSQIDSMRARLIGAGCDTLSEEVEEVEEEVLEPTSEDTATDSVENADTPSEDAPVATTGDAQMPEAPKVDGQDAPQA